MFIDFTIRNFRSIKNEQTLSLHAEAPANYLLDNITYPAMDKIGVLKSAGIYGANAAGKSNILLAFVALEYIVTRSGDLKEGDTIPCYEPYLLSEENKLLPTRFELEFFCPNDSQDKPLRYRYCVEFLSNKIIEESLVFYPSSQPATIFNRGKADDWQTITFGSLYKGGKKRLPFFPNNSYLSKAGDSADTPQMIRDVFNYFRQHVHHQDPKRRKTILNWFDKPELVSKVSTLLSLVDTGISNISFQEIDDPDDEIRLPHSIPEEIKTQLLNDIKNKPFFTHKTDSGTNELFEEQKESDGTQKLFHLAPLLINTLQNGGVLIMDEVDSSLHPLMAEMIIKIFNDPRINKKNAQLIFSTHNINLMSSELLRRDQIWFTEKHNGSTKLYSLDDFDKKKVKPQSPFNQWYAEGRFGGIPEINYQGIIDLFNSDETHAKAE